VPQSDSGLVESMGQIDFLELALDMLGLIVVLSIVLVPFFHFCYMHLILKTLRQIRQDREPDQPTPR
jgi:hypothetical protein